MSKKNLRTIKLTVTAQTKWHLEQLAKTIGCSPGQVIDKLIRSWLATMGSVDTKEKGGNQNRHFKN